MESLWKATAELPHFEALNKNINTDILIIGGGMAGILCAHELQKQGADYVLVEANTICSGITQNTTAKITAQHGFIYDDITKKYGTGAAEMYLLSNEMAVKKLSEMCRDIDCDFERRDNFVYTAKSDGKVRKEIDALRKIGYSAEIVRDVPLPVSIEGAVKFKNQAQFHPLKFCSEIAKHLNIYEHTKVTELIGMKANANGFGINAKKIIVATHFPLLNKHGMYFMKLYQHRSYVIALEGAADVGGMYVDEAQNGLSFRNAGGLLLLGGGDHRTGKKGGGWKELEEFAKIHYPTAKIKQRWATQDCMSLDSIPYIGRYSKNTPHMFVATGFNKWGMTSSMVSAMILCDMVQGRENPYSAVFNPERSVIHPQLAVNAFESVVSLLSPSEKRCPHMGCALKWNKEERSWDCPCHGSRFTENGELIDNPASGDIK